MMIPDTNPYLEFVQRHFPGEYMVTWYHNLMTYKLWQWVHGEIRNMIIEVPPQYGKSTVGAILIAPYILSEYPTARMAYTTYGDALAYQMSSESKDIMRGERYMEEFDELTVPPSQRSSYQWKTTLGGKYTATGRGGPLDGTPQDFLICDDLFKNDEEAMSPIIRDSAWRWFAKVALSRLSPTGRALLFFKRWHTDDVIGRAKKLMETYPDKARHYEIISFPALMTKEAMAVKHPADPRNVGDPLWPYKHSAKDLLGVRLETGEAGFNAVYQQTPVNAEGMKIKPKWFKKISQADVPSDMKKSRFYRFGELAKASIDENSATCLMGKTPGGKYIVSDLEYFDDDWPSCLSRLKKTGIAEKGNVVGVPEVRGKRADLFRQIMDCKDKRYRLKKCDEQNPIAWTPDAEAGKILLVENEQTQKFLEACRNYTGSGRDKREAEIHAVAGAWKMLQSRRSIVSRMAAKRV